MILNQWNGLIRFQYLFMQTIKGDYYTSVVHFTYLYMYIYNIMRKIFISKQWFYKKPLKYWYEQQFFKGFNSNHGEYVSSHRNAT